MENESQTKKQLIQEIKELRQYIDTLKQEKTDLEVLLEITIAHADLVEAQLQVSYEQLKAEMQERQSTEAKLEASQNKLQSLVEILHQEKQDLELILETTIEHSNFVEASLHYESIHDPLTGLFNRRHLEIAFPQSMSSAQQSQQPLSILLTDIDYFKRFNDNYGHKAGDVVLKVVSQVVQNTMRDSDMAFRYGGEELVIILPHTSLEIAQQIAEELRLRIKNLQQEYSYHFLAGITISIGVASFPEHSNTCDGLLQLADTALYQAKSDGRDRVVVAPILPP